MNRTILFLVTTITLIIPILGLATPPYLTHQGRIVDTSNNPIQGVTEITFSLYEQSDSETAIWHEVLSLALDNGYYTAILGTEENIDGELLDGSLLYLGVAVDEDEFQPR